MEQSIAEFFHDFRQDLLAGAESDGRFLLSEFMESMAADLVDTGVVDGFELCHFRAQRGMRVDGYWFDDEGVLNLFIADFDSREELGSLTRTELDAAFRRVTNFYTASADGGLAAELEVTAPEYGLAQEIADRKDRLRKLNFILLSERALSDRIKELPDAVVEGVPASYQIWDISRLQRLRSSSSQKEALDLDFEEAFGASIPCIPADLGASAYRSFLLVMPAEILASLYEKYGSRLLEQNVRTFLQVRGNVNKGIRATILNEPEMFFAYNNGITATAQEVETTQTDRGLAVSRLVDLQIVNGGQTTASLFHTLKRDKADLSRIFVQMKLSVVDAERSEVIVPRISEYANTQNRVSAADFFSNHPFHVRMEEFSRRIWAPAADAAVRETKWFYERARGQYADAQSKLTLAEKRRFLAEYPKKQMFTKTDLAKFENVWDDAPHWVNLGAQKNFAHYAERIGREWERSSDAFNEFYYKRAVARGIIFKATERIVSAQPWYNGGYRANIVAYTLAILGEVARRRKEYIDFIAIWDAQKVGSDLEAAITIAAAAVNEDITTPPQGISNISEWCKRESCWLRIRNRAEKLEQRLPHDFFERLVSREDHASTARTAKKTQKIDNGIGAQREVIEIGASGWKRIYEVLRDSGELTPKEDGILKVAMRIPAKLPSDKQSLVLLEILNKARLEGVVLLG